jgi:hypothetical protein
VPFRESARMPARFYGDFSEIIDECTEKIVPL